MLKLRQVDLNLLTALEVLLSESNVTRAAQILHVTQPAMSQTLQRLRTLFEDPLLVRQGGRMVLTPVAASLLKPLQRVLADLEAVLEERPSFAPENSKRTFVIATTDYIGTVLLPPLMAHLEKEAPNVGLDIRQIQVARFALALEQGEYELAVTVLDDAPGIVRENLFEEHHACLVRRGHPILRSNTKKRFASFAHVLMSPHGSGPGVMDRLLSESDLERRIALRVPMFALGPPVLKRSDAIMTLPSRLAAVYAAAYDLEIFAPPVMPPPFWVHQAWHLRMTQDAGHLWLRNTIRSIVSQLEIVQPRRRK